MKLVIFLIFFPLITFISGCSITTIAEFDHYEGRTNPSNWQKVGEENGNSHYVDIENIKSHEGFVYYWELIDFKEAIYGALSRISKFKANCTEKEKANLDVSAYTGQMGKHIKINEGKYSGTRFFGSSKSITMNFVCDHIK